MFRLTNILGQEQDTFMRMAPVALAPHLDKKLYIVKP
jgi:hypothetical protein